MNSSTSKAILSFLLLFAITFAALPQVGHAQAASQAAAVATDYSKALQTIEEKLDARRKALGIPGISLVIVKDDKVIYSKGLGYKDFEKKIAVTPDTQFAIGSATKAFTGLSVLMSQDEGKLSLDDSPKKYLPYFKMYDPETDKNITIRDLLCHSSGLNRTDLAMVTGKLNRAELIQVAAQAKPTAKLREKFQYQNIMFAAAGEIASVVQKQPYNKLIEDRIFKPLGMANSSMSLKEMQRTPDYSYGYAYNFDTKVTEKLPYLDIDEVAPAGSINSSANDMAHWLRFVLNGGTGAGKRLVSEKGYEEWLKPQMKIAGTTSYGFGWFLQDWNGLKVVQHGGNIDGFNSQVAMIPEKHLGFVLLTNVSASSLGNELMPIVWENLSGITLPDRSTDNKPKIDGTVAKMAPAGTERAKQLVGRYKGSGGGTVEVRESNGGVTFNIEGQQPYTLAETAPDTFSMSPLPASYSLAAKRDEAGKVVSVVVTQPEGNFEFKKGDADAKPTITADELLAKSIEAIGGEAAWRKLSTRVAEFDMDLENQGVQAHGTSYNKAPNKTAGDTTFTAIGKTIATEWEFFDGTNGQDQISFAPVDKYSGKRLEDVRLAADFYGPVKPKKDFKKIEVTSIAKVNGEEAYVVNFEPEKGSPYTEYYSTKTFLLLKRTGSVSSSTSDQKIPYTVLFSDYREVDGIKLPFKTVNSNIANGNIVTTIKSVKHNVPIDDKTFGPKTQSAKK